MTPQFRLFRMKARHWKWRRYFLVLLFCFAFGVATDAGDTWQAQKEPMRKFYVTGLYHTKEFNDCTLPLIEVYGKDRLDALTRVGMTVWTEEEWKEAEPIFRPTCNRITTTFHAEQKPTVSNLNLGTPPDGSARECSDCALGTGPCRKGQPVWPPQVLAMKIGGKWECTPLR